MGYEEHSLPALAMHIGRSRTLIRLFLSAALAAAGAGNLRAQDGTGSLAKPTTSIVAAAVATEVEGELTQLRITLSEPVEAHAQLMESPDRVIVDLPDNESATAVALTVNSAGGAVVRTVVLLTPEEVDAAAQRSVDYQPPGS